MIYDYMKLIADFVLNYPEFSLSVISLIVLSAPAGLMNHFGGREGVLRFLTAILQRISALQPSNSPGTLKIPGAAPKKPIEEKKDPPSSVTPTAIVFMCLLTGCGGWKDSLSKAINSASIVSEKIRGDIGKKTLVSLCEKKIDACFSRPECIAIKQKCGGQAKNCYEYLTCCPELEKCNADARLVEKALIVINEAVVSGIQAINLSDEKKSSELLLTLASKSQELERIYNALSH